MTAAIMISMAMAAGPVGPSSDLTHVGTWTTGLSYRARLAPAPSGGLYVTDPPMNKVVRLDSSGAVFATYTVAEGPVGIAAHTDGSGRVFVSRSDGKVGVYSATLVFDRTVNPTPQTMIAPNGLAFDSIANELYVVDGGANQVLVFREITPPDWTLARVFGMEGPELGLFQTPQAIAVDSSLNITQCTDSGTPWACCTGEGTGTCANASCTASGVPWACCTGAGTGACTNAACTGAPWACCTGEGTGTCRNVIVTDADNFRVQVFHTNGIVLFKFGYRTLYLPSMEVAWLPRTEGVAVDTCGNVYLSDALMGTVRVFDKLGKELDPDHEPVIGYGTGPDALREPCDVMINAGKMFVANTNNAAIEVYNVTCGAAAVAASGSPRERETGALTAKKKGMLVVDRSDGSYPARAGVPRMPDNPAEIVAVMNAGGFREDLDLNRDRLIDVDDLELAVTRFGAGTVDDFLTGSQRASKVASHDPVVPPHILEIANSCGRCHSMDGAPGGMLTALGQENLCQSCHSAGKIAGDASISAGNLQNSHPWNEDADEGVSDGPPPDSDLALHLDNGKIRCGTCHDPHENRPGGACVAGVCNGGPFDGSVCKTNSGCATQVKFMRKEIYHGEDHFASQGGTPENHALKRMTVMDPTLCGECHTDIVEQWRHVGHAETEADPWTHYDWSMGNNWLCTGRGTPYAYCTGAGAGTVTSPALALCTGPATPLACCTGAGTGTCSITNASCTGVRTPWNCCLGAGTGNCIANSACTGAGAPSPCCTGAGAGTCTNSLPAVMCSGVETPEPCCTGPGAGSCSDRSSCRQCHSGNGYIDFSKDFPDGTVATSTHRGALRVIDCLVCHSTHGSSEDGKLLRIYDTVRLPTGQVFSGVGGGATCMSCHNGRSIPSTNPSSVSSPHYLNGAAMLEGINAVTAFPGLGPNSACTGAGAPWACCTGAGAGTCPATAYTLTNSNHTTNADLNCTTCHMAAGPTSGPEVDKVGGHTFRLKNHGTGYENVATSCNTTDCHGGDPVVSLDHIADIGTADCTGAGAPHACCTGVGTGTCGDYDGDGTVEGVQTETTGLLNLLKDALYTLGASRLLRNPDTGLAATEPEICTGVGTPLACCTGVHTGPTCVDPDAEPANPYWTLRRCTAGSRMGLACNGSGSGTAPFDCPGGGSCSQVMAAGTPTVTAINAIWNWEFVDNSGDRGVKNTGYATGLLQVAYKGVAGNALARVDLCTAAGTPWACCTGTGTGTCSTVTAYRYSPAP